MTELVYFNFLLHSNQLYYLKGFFFTFSRKTNTIQKHYISQVTQFNQIQTLDYNWQYRNSMNIFSHTTVHLRNEFANRYTKCCSRPRSAYHDRWKYAKSAASAKQRATGISGSYRGDVARFLRMWVVGEVYWINSHNLLLSHTRRRDFDSMLKCN